MLLCQGEELSAWFLFLQVVIVLYKLTQGNFAPLGSSVFSCLFDAPLLKLNFYEYNIL